MTYEEALDRIHSLHRFKKVPGLAHLRELLHALGDPQDKLRFVHIAGTNGKGSTAALLASVLRKTGLRTGLYTSPFLEDFCERMQLNGHSIPHSALALLAEEVLPPIDAMERAGKDLSEFEAVTAMALHWFAQQNCDMVVLEVGLGGRLDATNVIPAPLCAVITRIALDHTDILGHTIAQIALEKCGIIKAGAPVVCAPDQDPAALAVIRDTCQQRGCPLTVADATSLHVVQDSLRGMCLSGHNLLLRLPLLGAHQLQNAATALACAQVLRTGGVRIPQRAIESGFAAVQFPGRFELLWNTPPVVLDGAHNPDAAAALAASVRHYLPNRRLVALTGMCADKDAPDFIRTLAPLCSEVVTLPVQNPRSMAAPALAALWQQAGVPAQVGAYPAQALALALHLAGNQGAVLICGSLYLAGELRPVAREILPLL